LDSRYDSLVNIQYGTSNTRGQVTRENRFDRPHRNTTTPAEVRQDHGFRHEQPACRIHNRGLQQSDGIVDVKNDVTLQPYTQFLADACGSVERMRNTQALERYPSSQHPERYIKSFFDNEAHNSSLLVHDYAR
jgi:hypothetical protein